MEIPERLREQFYQVTRERIKDLGPILDGLVDDPANRSLYEPAFQIFHKVHGSAAIYGHEKLGDIAGLMEGLLYATIQNNLDLEPPVVELMIEIRECLTKVVDGSECDESKYEHFRTRIGGFIKKDA